MLMLAQPRPLAALYRGCTYYEAALIGPDGKPAARLGFDAKRTKRTLFRLMCKHGPAIIELTAMAEDEEFCWQGGAYALPRGWRVAWTGETERDVAAREGARA